MAGKRRLPQRRKAFLSISVQRIKNFPALSGFSAYSLVMLRVNGELIDPEMVEETFSRIKSEAETRLQVSCCEKDDEFLAQAEEEVANSVLIAQEAETRFPIIKNEEVLPRLEDMIKLYREQGASWEMLEAQRAQMRMACAANLRMEKLIADETSTNLEATEEEITQFYAENECLYRHDPEAHCLHLIKLFSEANDPNVLYHEVLRLRKKLLAGADFAELSKKETDKLTGEVDLGWIDFDRPTNPFEAMLFSLEEGEISPVLAYEHAFHLVKVVAVKAAYVTPLEDVHEEIATRVVQEKKRAALQKLARTLRESATIEKVDFSGD